VVQRNEPATELALVDDQTLFREGVRALVEREPDLAVVLSAPDLSGCDGADVAPRVVVTELTLPDAPRDQVVPLLRTSFPDAAIVALTWSEDLPTVQRTIAAGASGYVLKNATPAELLAGIRAVAGGGTYLQPSIGVAFASRSPLEGLQLNGSGLTPKETEVLRLLALGHTNAEIAQLLGASLRTIETHRSHIHQKLGRHTRAELVRYSLDAGLLRADAGNGGAKTNGAPARTNVS
jgi:two-component system, NarL family, response regulator NreC